MANETGRELNWDDTIERDGNEPLQEGDYDFRVISFERGRHAGSDKLPPCNKAIVTIQVLATDKAVELKHNLFLHTSTEGILSAFFGAIGQKKRGEKLQMNWTTVPGSTGRCKVGIRNWKNDQGEDRQSNEIKRFYPKEDKAFVPGRF